MILHYLKTAWRNIRSNWVYSLLSVCCLAIGTAMFSALFYGVKYDDFFENRLYGDKRHAMLYLDILDHPEYVVPFYIMHPRVKPEYLSGLDIPGAESISYYFNADLKNSFVFSDSCKVYGQGTLRYKRIRGDFFRFHNLTLLYGDRSPQNENEIVVYESLLKRIGYDKDISQLKATNTNNGKEYQVVNVVRDDRWSRSFGSGSNIVFQYYNWSGNNNPIGMDVDVIIDKDADIDLINKTLALSKFTDEDGNTVILQLSNDYKKPKDTTTIIMVSLLGVIVLLVATTNFLKHMVMLLRQRNRVNLIRYSIGAKQKSLSLMLIVEALLILFCSLAVSLFISYYICTWLNSSVYRENYFHFPDIVIINTLVVLVVGMVSATVCRVAVYGQNKILRNRIVACQRERTTWKYIAICLEMTVSVFALASVIYISLTVPRPYNPLPESECRRTFYVECTGDVLPSVKSIELINRIKSLPQVEELLPTSKDWNGLNNNRYFCFGDKHYFVGLKNADVRYFSFFNIPVEWFEPEHPSWGYLIDRKLYDRLITDSVNMENIVMKKNFVSNDLTDEERIRISGVFEHLMCEDLSANAGQAGSAIMYNTEQMVETFCFVKFKEDVSRSQAEALIREAWNDVDVSSIDELSVKRVPKYNNNEDRLTAMAFKTGGFVCILLVILSVTSSISAETNVRRKEVALRKINGAKARNIMELFIKPYCIILAVAFPIGFLASVVLFGGETGGDAMAFVWIAPLTLVVIALMVAISIFSRIRASMRTNPADVIKSE